MKIKRLILSIIGVTILVAMTFNKCVEAASDLNPNLYFGTYENDFATSQGTNGSKVMKFKQYSAAEGGSEISNSAINLNNAFCARANRGFYDSNGYNSALRGTYNKKYTMNTEKNKCKTDGVIETFSNDSDRTISNSDGSKNVSTYNAILALADLMYLDGADNKDKLIKDAIAYYNSIDSLAFGYTTYEDLANDDNLITDDQIRAIQQAAVWTFTNHDENGYDVRNNTRILRYKDGTEWYSHIIDSDKDEWQSKQADAIYKYLVNTAIDNASTYNNTTYPAKNEVYLYTNIGYIQSTQPIIVIVPHKEFDLALRKYIVKVGNTELTGADKTRTPVIDLQSTLNDPQSGETTAKYKHRKQPVSVKTNDLVTYAITIYNEGDQDGKAVEIKDQLPAGLTFMQEDTEAISSNANYTFSFDTNTNLVTITAKNTLDNLNKYNGTELDSTTVKVVCKVTETADSTNSKYLTNIAWISKAYNAEKGVEENINPYSGTEIGHDRDSAPGTYPNYTKDALRTTEIGYIGNSSNDVNKLNDSTYFFKGQQDDDDFEKVKIAPIQGEYNIYLIKTDSRGHDTESKATFEIKDLQKNTTTTKEVKGTVNVTGTTPIKITSTTGTDKYEIKELIPPDKYCKFDGTIKIEVSKKEVNGKYVLDSSTFKVMKGETDITNEIGDDVNVYVRKNDDENYDLYVKVKDYQFDLKLLKRITAVNDKEVKNRITSVDVTPLVDGTDTTAIYKMEKDPVKVKKGDIVTYTLRVYNEGEVDGYASELTEDVPEGLEFINDNEINTQYGWTEKTVDGKKVIVTNYLDKQPNDPDDKNLIKAFDKTKAYSDTEGSKNPDYREVKIALKVVSSNTNSVIRNEAEISDDKDKDGNEVTDRDSTPEEWKKEEDKDKDYDDKGKWHPYKEDDEDYDNIELEIFDLSLRKFISKVGKDESMKDATQYQRAPQVDTSKLNKDGNTTAIYNHTKEPVQVNVGDYVEYTLRVYNEGTADGYAAEIKDHLPVYLEYVDGEFNKAYGWHAEKENGRTVIVTDYLKDTLLKATKTDANGKITLDSSANHELKILCRVVTTAPLKTKITNIADISKYEDSNHKEVEDRDSSEDNVNVPAEKDLPSYKDDETGSYIPGQEDDDDFEKVITPEIFDLALRKFITKIEDKDVTTRIPKVEYKDNKITYTHPKDALDVVNGNVVTYTLRIFNEGEINGYASVITDDIPKGVQFIPDNEINKQYRWVMYEEADDQSIEVDGKDVVECKVKGSSEVKKYKVTTDVTKAAIVRTDYLSKEQGEARMKEDKSITKNPNLIKAFDKEAGVTDTNPDYKDIQVAFLVTEKNGSKKIITNYAQISDDTDEFGNEVEDIDSTPDKWNEGEDDQDIENIKLPLFDLALRKWVTQAIVIENGKTTVTKTGHDAWDDPEGIVKVELHRKKLSNVTVKFRYSIRVYNQGEIEGYAKEITDYIPQGLKFIAKDNPQWKDKGNNVITTDALKNTLLKPGESADVEVLLTWVNDKNNMGLKVNTAEISKDYNKKGVPDKDSTPNNKKPGEDDIDDAPVMLSITTGSEITYYAIGLGVLVVLAGGIFLIKKYVL